MDSVSITPVRLPTPTPRANIEGERRGITVLPGELIQQIFTDACISRDDLKSLRLLCRTVTEEATQLLFYRICLSKLKIDRHAFLNIATSPRLAAAVRVLAWYELAEEEPSLSPLRPRPAANLGATNNDYWNHPLRTEDSEEIYRDLVVQARDAFWMPSQDGQIAAIEEFRPHFYAALDAMPNLHIVITQPMHPYRRLTKPLAGYNLTAQLLHTSMMTDQSETNEGFYSLLGLAMARRSSTNTPITRLHFADEGQKTSLVRLNPTLSPAFAPLTHIDFCISHLDNPSYLDGLDACLRAAMNLTHLRLCCERGTSFFTLSEEEKAVFDILLCHPAAHWARLHSLHLCDLWFPTVQLLQFARKHASSLRCLRADSCSLTADAVASLVGIAGLRLKQFVALPSSAYEDCIYISEARVLAFLNSGGTDITLGQALRENKSAQVRTHAAVFDLECWATGAICDTRGRDGLRLGYTVNEIDMLDLENGDVRDGDGFTYEEGSCWEMPFETGHLGLHGMAEEHEEDEYAIEQASHLKRCREAPRWMWGRENDGQGDVYYWIVENEDGPRWAGQPTEMWRFEHRNGEFAFGDDPLEFWEDWEGSEAGDFAEATPFGWEFRSYLLGQKSGRSPPNPWGPVPEGRAVQQYYADQDSMYLNQPGWREVLLSTQGRIRAHGDPSLGDVLLLSTKGPIRVNGGDEEYREWSVETDTVGEALG
ncbi:hypothetical protein N431DRAFT_554919 [Stipitochalara longipes BDJ]|nr:hypothetical protein N431DRAFT_554919 [Stipitochalara longipes BDJ]